MQAANAAGAALSALANAGPSGYGTPAMRLLWWAASLAGTVSIEADAAVAARSEAACRPGVPAKRWLTLAAGNAAGAAGSIANGARSAQCSFLVGPAIRTDRSTRAAASSDAVAWSPAGVRIRARAPVAVV